MKTRNINTLTVSIALTLMTALCIPAFAGAGTTIGNVRNSLSAKETIRLDREEDKAGAWFEESSHLKTEASIGNVRSNLTDTELKALNRDEGSSMVSSTDATIGSVREGLSKIELAALNREE